MSKTKIMESFHQGHCTEAYKLFGAHLCYEPEEGTRFTVWAPGARNIQVVGDFNNWGEEPIWMEKITSSIFSVFVPHVKEWSLYRYRIECFDGIWQDKSDPFAFYSEVRPKTASIVVDMDDFKWTDKRWMNARSKNFDKPMNIYEVHAGSWRTQDGLWLTYDDLSEQLIPYVKKMGFTHIELMPLNEHPFDGSWGYQASGYYSCTSRYGDPKQFMNFMNEAHKAGIGVIMDVVPVHFVKDMHGLRYFDGTAVYEYSRTEDALSEWGTMNFDLWKEEVRSFLMSAISFWCDKYHIDGIRMDAISNVIFWGGNKNRGVNEGGLAFIRRMNYYLSTKYPEVMLIAEDSSDFPKVTASTYELGLGFDYKWDLGWMNDTLKYYKLDPIYRKYNHNKLTFSMAYFYSERFLLPLSHDEVVHGKLTIVDKMWGDYDQKFAQVKNLYLYMYTHPGKKLNFMGNEIGMFREFDEKRENDWFLLDYSRHAAFARFFEDMSLIYKHHPALSCWDYDPTNFSWIDADNGEQSIYSYLREDAGNVFVMVLNMTPVSYEEFRIGVPVSGKYTELINTEKDIYEGCNMGNYEPVKAEKIPAHRYEQSISIRIAPFAGIIFQVKKRKPAKKKEEVSSDEKAAATKKTVKKSAAETKEKAVKKPAAKKAASKKAEDKKTKE